MGSNTTQRAKRETTTMPMTAESLERAIMLDLDPYLHATPGAIADYGMDTNVYKLAGEDVPSEDHRRNLVNRYKRLFSDGMTAQQLHTRVYVNKEPLSSVLGPGFEWVRTIAMLV